MINAEKPSLGPTNSTPLLSRQGHPLPRRSSPGNSVTLKHHRVARDGSLRDASGREQQKTAQKVSNTTSSSRRNSSGDSHDTGQSDPNKWFDQSNKNPTATFDSHAMDIDPPFFQRETDSSNEGRIPDHLHMAAPARLAAAQSSSADEYRSVIDDLTVEIQKLKDELKRYQQKGPDMLRKDKLFEIKYHGLPRRKKRELESTLREFTASLGSSPDAASSSRKAQKSKDHRDRMYSNSGSMSKHASSSSGSNNRPVDSAYASMSTGAHSSGQSVGRHQSVNSRYKTSEQKVESYLRDIPEGLYPRNVMMTDKERKKLVVRRLEQLFTGKISGRYRKESKVAQPEMNPMLQAVVSEGQKQQQFRPPVSNPAQQGMASASASANEPSREARILSHDEKSGNSKISLSRDNGSASNSGGDHTESNGNGSGTNNSPPEPTLPEQRPTRLQDLDPDRVQIPSENMNYIKHLGLVPPELIKRTSEESEVHPDAEGWVYLNLLCSLAQLHMINVTPDFVRSAVSGMSAKFQLSPDGRKIRWKGGSDGTKFSSDSSEEGVHKSLDNEDTDSNKDTSRKRQKTGQSTGDDFQSGSSNSKSKAGAKISSPDSFHYKPLFVHRPLSGDQSSPNETLSSFGPIEDSNLDDSGWGLSGSGGTGNNRRKRRRDGAIIYYSGAPFCTDLCGDPGSASPVTYMMSSGQVQHDDHDARPELTRTASGSSLALRPLTQQSPFSHSASSKMDVDDGVPALAADSGTESDSECGLGIDLAWTNQQQFLQVHPLEPCGLGGVMPEDHFMVVVTTKRPKEELARGKNSMSKTEETTDSIIGRLASMSTSSPAAITATSSRREVRTLEIEYTSGRIKRLAPVRLPPPAIFFPPFSSEDSSDMDDLTTSYGDDEMESSEVASRRADVHHSDGYPDGVDLTSGDEDGEDPEDEPETAEMYVGLTNVSPGALRERRRQSSAEATARTDRSSAATVGGAVSVGTDDDMSS